jgi:AcrR family transcriptional regulator
VTTADGADPAKRRQILDGARQVFRARGFDGASMGDIAKAAGVSKGTLYVYFDSKEALFAALLTLDRRIQAEALFQLDATDPDVHRVLRRLGIDYLELMVRPEHVANVRMVIGVAEKFPDVGRAFYRAGPERGQNLLSAYLDAQVAAGRLRIADTGWAARHFLDLCQAGTLRRLLLCGGPTPDRTQQEQQITEALRVFFAAYGPE